MIKKALNILILLCCYFASPGKNYFAKGPELDKIKQQVWWQCLLTTGCPPDPYPQYPWAAGTCSSNIGNNDWYAVFNIADSVLYRFSGGTVIVNTPGCPPLPNPYYPYDANCNITIGNYDIYAVWYVLHLIDSILIVNPPSGVKVKIAPTYMTYGFSTSQIDTMPWLWKKDSQVIEMPFNNGFKALGVSGWLDQHGFLQFRIDTSGVWCKHYMVAPYADSMSHSTDSNGFGIIFGRQNHLGPYPYTGINDTAFQWYIQTMNHPSASTGVDMIFRDGLASWYYLLYNRGHQDTLATLRNLRTSGSGVTGTGTAPHYSKWVNNTVLANANLYDNLSETTIMPEGNKLASTDSSHFEFSQDDYIDIMTGDANNRINMSPSVMAISNQAYGITLNTGDNHFGITADGSYQAMWGQLYDGISDTSWQARMDNRNNEFVINATSAVTNKLCINYNTPDANSIIDISHTTSQYFLPPRMTTVQMQAITPVTTGAMVYCTDTNALYVYTGTGALGGWAKITAL